MSSSVRSSWSTSCPAGRRSHRPRPAGPRSGLLLLRRLGRKRPDCGTARQQQGNGAGSWRIEGHSQPARARANACRGEGHCSSCARGPIRPPACTRCWNPARQTLTTGRNSTCTREDETFLVLDGHYRFLIGDDEVVAERGAVLFSPREIPHRFEGRRKAQQGGRGSLACSAADADIGDQGRRGAGATGDVRIAGGVSAVKEFGRTLATRMGGPAGHIECFIQVPFSIGQREVQPDGLIRVTRGNCTWTCLVEVKTGPLRPRQRPSSRLASTTSASADGNGGGRRGLLARPR